MLLGGRLADLLGRKVTFLVGLVGFAGVSAIGGVSVNFAMLVTARACQGAFAALLVPSALSVLVTTFTEQKERAKCVRVFGAIAVAGGAVGLLLGGAPTEYLSWRWTLYVNLFFAGVAFIGGALLLQRQPSGVKPRLDIPGVLLVSGAVFCLVYGFSNAGTHSWDAPSTYGFIVAGVVLGPSRLDRAPIRLAWCWTWRRPCRLTRRLFGICRPCVRAATCNPRRRLPVDGLRSSQAGSGAPRPLVAGGMLAAAGGAAWLAQLGPHTGYGAGVVGPLILAAVGMGMVIAPSISTGTFGVAPQDAGVASATVTVGQQLGASIGTSLLNTIFTAAVASYLAAHLASARLIGRQALNGLALAHGYDTAFWWTAGTFAAGAVISGALFRNGPLRPTSAPSPAAGVERATA